jgi:hypothetical protein
MNNEWIGSWSRQFLIAIEALFAKAVSNISRVFKPDLGGINMNYLNTPGSSHGVLIITVQGT